jgi:hypothetical protein
MLGLNDIQDSKLSKNIESGDSKESDHYLTETLNTYGKCPGGQVSTGAGQFS